MSYFEEHRWPGNVRELENVIERIIVLSDGELVRLSDLPSSLRVEPDRKNLLQLKLAPEGISLEAVEKELILTALRCPTSPFDGMKTRSA